MIRCKTIFLFIAFWGAINYTNAQLIERYNTFSYNVNEGLLQSNIGDLAFDKHNFCWISFANGIQKFNGKTFTNIPLQQGLPDDKWVNFFTCSNGDLLISHAQGISKYDISSDKFKQVYFNNEAFYRQPVFIGEDDQVIYFYTAVGSITGIDNKTYKVVSETSTPFPLFPLQTNQVIKFSSNIINHKVAIIADYTLYIWDLKNKKTVAQAKKKPSVSSFTLYLLSEHEVMYYNYDNNGMIEYFDVTTQQFKHNVFLNTISFLGSRVNVFSWQQKLVVSVNNRLYETDEFISGFSKELVNLQNLPIAGNGTIAKLKQDNFGNLYLVTINAGFKKIIRNNYQVKYFGTLVKDSNYTLSILPDKMNNRIILGTYGNGLLVFDTLQHLQKHIKFLPGKTTPFSLTTIVKTNTGEYLLYIVSEKCIWKLNKNMTALSRIYKSQGNQTAVESINYFSKLIYQNNKEVLVQAHNTLLKVDLAGNLFSESTFAHTYNMSGILTRHFILTHTNDELLYIDSSTLQIVKRIPFKNTGHVRCFAKKSENSIYIGSNKGIFVIDSTGKTLKHYTISDGLPDECIYAMEFDNQGLLWCSTNKGIFKLNSANTIFQLRRDDGLQENEFNTNVVAKTADGEMYFGGINGVNSFYPTDISSFEEKVRILVTGIRINNDTAFKDTATWNINSIKLPYNQNNLSFDFIAMANNNPGQYIYQYKMEGIDKEWLQNNELQTLRYTLPPGKYNLKLYASRFFDINAKPLKEISILIEPPYWRTWWFRLCLTVILVSLLVYFINQYNKRKYNKKLHELQSEHKLQMERERISRDLHDSIGAYANAVLYKTDLLQKEEMQVERNELMNDLKYASKDIISALRETIWALQREEYSAEECLVRIRNFIQPFNRYYPDIRFTVQGNADAEKKLNNNKALNLVRIVQEAVTNSIKHAGAKNISVNSEFQKDAWKLTISDDGSGFNYKETKNVTAGNGLNNMKQRAIDAGFNLTFESADNGTIISIFV